MSQALRRLLSVPLEAPRPGGCPHSVPLTAEWRPSCRRGAQMPLCCLLLPHLRLYPARTQFTCERTPGLFQALLARRASISLSPHFLYGRVSSLSSKHPAVES